MKCSLEGLFREFAGKTLYSGASLLQTFCCNIEVFLLTRPVGTKIFVHILEVFLLCPDFREFVKRGLWRSLLYTTVTSYLIGLLLTLITTLYAYTYQFL